MATSIWYGLGLEATQNGGIDLDTDTIVAILCDNTYTPAQDTDQFISDLTGEVTDASYARQTLTTLAVSYDGASNTVKWTADPVTWTALTASFQYFILAKSTGTDTTSPLIKVTDFASTQTASGNDVTITPASTGLTTVVAS